MIASQLHPMLALLAQLGREPAAPLRLWLRTTSHRLRPPRPAPHTPRIHPRQDALLATGAAGPQHCADIRCETSAGPQPTLVVGGFVPDAPEAVYLFRGGLLRQGSLYYFNYPRRAFSTALALAQLGDLVEELAATHRRPPVVLAISFGAGLVLEWLRHCPSPPPLGGLVLVSPVTGVEDLLDPAAPKPTTLLGRVLRPYLDAASPDTALVERSRTAFLKMFEAGAQNRDALRLLLTREETLRLRDAVLATIHAIEPAAARERVQALRTFAPFQAPRPLHPSPTLILFSEKEDSVLQTRAPGLAALRDHTTDWFPRGRCLTVTNRHGHPVQHASLIFHARDFHPPIAAFYRSLRTARRHAA